MSVGDSIAVRSKILDSCLSIVVDQASDRRSLSESRKRQEPVFPSELCDATEITSVTGHEDRALFQRNRGDGAIHHADIDAPIRREGQSHRPSNVQHVLRADWPERNGAGRRASDHDPWDRTRRPERDSPAEPSLLLHQSSRPAFA